MKRPERSIWERYLGPRDRAALVIVLTIVLAMVTLLVLVLF